MDPRAEHVGMAAGPARRVNAGIALTWATALIALAGCRLGIRPIDVARTSRAVADAKREPSLPRTYLLGAMLGDRAPFAWTGTTMELSRRGPRSHPRARLVVELLDARGGRSEFTVDTGTSISCCSTCSSVAATATRDAAQDCATFKDGSLACRATLASLRASDLRATNAPVLLVDRPHDLCDSTNLFGMTWMAGLALVHDVEGDRWRFVPGGSIPPRAGWAIVRMEAPALPVVRLLGVGGSPIFALIDTGAPTSLVERGTPRAHRVVVDDAGRVALDVAPDGTAPWTGLDPGGRHVSAWIGLADLEKRSFVMDFSTGLWSIAPSETITAGRPPPGPTANRR